MTKQILEFLFFVKLQFKSIPYNDFNMRIAYLMLMMLHETNFLCEIAFLAFHIVKGMREPECALHGRPSHKDHEIRH